MGAGVECLDEEVLCRSFGRQEEKICVGKARPVTRAFTAGLLTEPDGLHLSKSVS